MKKLLKITRLKLTLGLLLAITLSGAAYFGFTSIHPLPQFATRRPALGIILRIWPLVVVLPAWIICTILAIVFKFVDWWGSDTGPDHREALMAGSDKRNRPLGLTRGTKESWSFGPRTRG